ncbi:MAG: 3-hydroxybutyryl-CoA dehydrogenase [Actinobacteria bacterium]|nr:3-hydroxybutyryl-CoA dehydrogenase [Actinomycetota bacterium]MSW41267.1 3-hydroxybutyryl-CoA dehydrogenase [Actinomycetota bacterium]
MSTALPSRCGVVGGGRMGSGIAHALLVAGSEVTLVESGADTAEAARQRVTDAVRESEARALLSEAVETVLSRLRVVEQFEALAASGLVIEAVPEDLALKIDVVRAIEAVVSADAVIATNTSSLPVSDIASASERPERVIGLHFFNPVPASVLVEIVVADQMASGLVDVARGWVVALGKTPIVVRDSPGFASSRLGVVLGLEAIRMLEEGVASADDIDTAMALGYRHPVGPLRLTDIVGLDVRLDIARHLELTLGPRFAPPALLIDKVKRGELGRKSGQGFYSWHAS